MGKNILIIIPARGGSKGIPRKNLRPLNGRPLITYAIDIAQKSKYSPDIFVSSEDEEILSFVKRLGVNIHKREMSLAEDITTLDSVIINAYAKIIKENNKKYDAVVTMQPTSPLLTTNSLDEALDELFSNSKIDTVISAIPDKHLTWKKENQHFVPNYLKRVNRQELPDNYKETGGFLIAKPENFIKNTRIGDNVSLYDLPPDEGIDIDDYNDWALCNYYLKRKHIVFIVKGYSEIGLGHIYNCLGLANEILEHKITFLLDKKSHLGYEVIKSYNYTAILQTKNILTELSDLNPDLIINDVLDTSITYMSELKKMNCPIVNIEDLGEGANMADIVINAIYPEKEKKQNHYFGPAYFCAREEFYYHPDKIINETVKSILISFGGVDPNNYTKKILDSIYPYCVENNITINVVCGIGYTKYDTIQAFDKVNIHRNVKNISDYFHNADIVFSSAGRTIYELAILKTPTIVLAQNERELTHFFAYEEFGFINMGLGTEVNNDKILSTFSEYTSNHSHRIEMSNKMAMHDIVHGKTKVIKLITSLL